MLCFGVVVYVWDSYAVCFFGTVVLDVIDGSFSHVLATVWCV